MDSIAAFALIIFCIALIVQVNINRKLNKRLKNLAVAAKEIKKERDYYKDYSNKIYKLAVELQAMYNRERMGEDDLNKILRLVHPDKHGNSKSSNEVTQMILKRMGK